MPLPNDELAKLQQENALLREQLRVADVSSSYHIRRARLLEEANENANKAVEALCLEIERLYLKFGMKQ